MSSSSESSSSTVAPVVDRPWYRRVGPGLITACVVIGPGSILSSSKIGAADGYSKSWVVVLAVVFMMTYMQMGARLGVLTGRAPGDLVAERAGRALAALIGVGVFFIAAAFQFGNNLGVHSAFQSLGWDWWGTIVLFNLLSISFLLFFKNLYAAVEKLMMGFVALMLLSFLLNLSFAGPNLAEAAQGFIPQASGIQIELLALVGTTFVISAGYFQAYLAQQKGWDKAELRSGMIDARIGSVIMALITLMLIWTAAAGLQSGPAVQLGFESETIGQALSEPWIATGSVVVDQEAQSPLNDSDSPGTRGVRLGGGPQVSSLRYPFASGLWETPGRRRYFSVDFRTVVDADQNGGYRFYLGHGAEGSKAIEFRVTATEFAIHNKEGWEICHALNADSWYKLTVKIDPKTNTYSGTIGSTDDDQTSFKDKSTSPNWDGIVDTFICDELNQSNESGWVGELDNVVFRDAKLEDVKDVAQGLNPLFGGLGTPIFCLGLFSAAYSSFLVNSMIGGFILSDGFGLGFKQTDFWPKAFTVLVLLTGMFVALYVINTGVKPVTAIVFAQALTVIASPLMAGALLWLCNRRDLLGDQTNGPIVNLLGGLGFLLLLAMAGYTLVYKVVPGIQGLFGGA